MPHSPFVPLHVFSAYTMLEGAIEPKVLAKHARKLGFPACAITDRNGLYGVMPLSEAALAAGVQRLIGALLAIGRAHVCTPVTNTHLVCRLLLPQKKETL